MDKLSKQQLITVLNKFGVDHSEINKLGKNELTQVIQARQKQLHGGGLLDLFRSPQLSNKSKNTLEKYEDLRVVQ